MNAGRVRRPAPVAIFDRFSASMAQVHEQLRQGVGEIERIVTAGGPAAGARAAAGIERFCETLLNHHRSEDVFFFPAFRSEDEEHVPIHRLATELQALGRDHPPSSPERWSKRVLLTTGELGALSVAHFAAEERVLTPDKVAMMITTDALGAVYRDMGRNWLSR